MWRRRHHRSPSPPAGAVRVLYIAGLGRSGSTLLDRLLGEHPAATSVGELVRLWERGVLGDVRCSCGQPFSECPFWSSVGLRAFGGWDTEAARAVVALQRQIDRIRYIPFLLLPGPSRTHHEHVAALAGVTGRLYRAIAETAGADVVVDSSKQVSTAFLLRRSAAVDLRVVHLVRDSRGVAYSWAKTVQKPDAKAGDELMDRYRPARTAASYVITNVLVHLLALVGVPSRFLRYERLVANPAGEVAKLLDFAGCDSTAVGQLAGDRIDLGTMHSVGGNPMRFRAGPLRVQADERWRADLPRTTKFTVTLMTAPLLALYGYLFPQRRGRRAASRANSWRGSSAQADQPCHHGRR